jgi:VWFA-related protein
MSIGDRRRNTNFPAHSILTLLAIGALLTVLAAGGVAQENSNPAAAQGQAGAAIHVRTNLVMVRVVVRDAKGNPVSGLARSDFHVFDNKKEQSITHFSAETPTAAGPAVAQGPASSAKNSVAAKPTPPPIAASAPQRFTARFFDDYHMQFANLVEIREAAKRYLDKNLDQGARVAMYSTSGRVHLDFTKDRAKLEQAAAQLQFDLRAEPLSEYPPMTDFQAQEIEDNNFMGSGSGSGDGGAGLASPPGSVRRRGAVSGGLGAVIDPLAIAGAVAEVLKCDPEGLRTRATYIADNDSRDAETTLKVLNGLVQRMAQTPGGERTIAMVSEGFLNKPQLQEQLDALIDRALHDKVIINALDAVGLYSPEDRVYAELAGSPQMARAYADLQVDSVNFDADVMAQVAEGTGGTFIKNNNDFEGGLKKMSAPYTTYVLGFSPAGLKFDGKFHALKVKLPNFGTYTVQTRRGYFAPKHAEDLATTENDELDRAVFSQDEMNGLPVQFSSRFSRLDSQTAKFTVTVLLDIRALRFRRENDRNFDNVTFRLALFDGDGNYIIGQNRTLNMQFSDATLKKLDATDATLTVAVNVKRGSYLVRGALLDAGSQQLGSVSENITIP